MSCQFTETANFISSHANVPAGTLAATDLPASVTAELNAENFSVPSFLKLIPALGALFVLFSKEGATIDELVDQLKAILSIFKGGDSPLAIEVLEAEGINIGTMFKLLPLVLELFKLFNTEGVSFAQILQRIMEILGVLKTA